MRRMLTTLMVLVVAMKSRTFSSFLYSANEQVCRSWEGAEPGSQPKLARGNIPYHRRHPQFMNGGWPRGLESSLLWDFELFCEFTLSSMSLASSVKFARSAKSAKFVSSRKPAGSTIASWLCNWSSGGKKHCNGYSLFYIFIIIISSSSSISLVVLLNYLNPRVFFSFSPSH